MVKMHLRFVICSVLLNLGKSKQSEGENFFLRLVDGDSICSGRVELFYNDTWGTVCDDYWDMPDAVVVCRQINCGFAQSARGSSQFGEGLGVIWLDDVECVGSESNLRQCKIRIVGEHNCNHVEDAGVICNPEHPPKPSIYSGKKSGVFIKGEDVKIKCSTLGYYTASMFYLYKDNAPSPLLTKSPASRQFTATFHLANITDGHSGNYSCRYDSDISGKTYSSERSENVDIMLREYLPAPDIVYSRASNVIIEGQDITLRCQTQEQYEHCRFYLFKDDETNPIDYQMASNTKSFVHFNMTEIGQEDEGSYFCRYEVIVNEKLNFNSSFSDRLNITVQDGVKLRLSNRDSACEGELEVLYNATWGKVCGRGWRITEVEVVCKHLGCGFGKSAVSTERYGFGTDDVKLNYVHCLGTEKLLWNCLSLSWSENTCFDHFRAHVTCSEQPLKPSITVYRTPSVYMPGENVTLQCAIAPYYIGSQMFLHKVGEKKSLLSVPVPPNEKSVNFTIVDIQSKQTGNYTCSYDIDISETVFNSEPSDPQAITIRDEPPGPTLSVEKDPPNYLPGQEIALQCKAPVYFTVSQYYLYKDTRKDSIMSHSVTDQDIPALFQITAENSNEEGEYMCQYETNSTGKLYNSTLSDPIKISVAADIKLRLADGGQPCSGRIECFVNGTWATICDEDWDLAEAEVACRQLHCGFARSATRSGSFGEGSGPSWAKNLACNGTETYLWVCPYQAVYPHICPMRNDVGVVCSDQPLEPVINIRRPIGRFSQGENVTIDCKAPAFYRGAMFFLYKTNQQAHLQSRKADEYSNTVAFLLTKISTFHEGSYTCSYQVVRDGRPSTSDTSSQVQISIIDKPPKPKIVFFGSLGQFSIGETALVRCIAPSAYYGVTFVLSKVEISGYITIAIAKTPGHSTILYIKDIRLKAQGDYVCMYQITRSGIVYNSTFSERKSLTVSDELQKPQATLNRPHGQYLQGQDAELTCSAPKVYSSLTFSLHKAGNPMVIASQGPMSNWSVVLEIRQLETQHQGSYYCVYQTTISGRLYTSAPSESLNVTLTGEPEGAKMTLTTMFGLYVQGKSIRITCIAPEYYNTRSFRLIKDGKDTGRTWTTTQWTKQGAEFSIANITVADSGNYTCTYEAEISDKSFNSSYSNFVAIDVVERVQIRLKNGSHDCSGRVEVLSNKTWGTVCDDQWQIEDAQIVCRELACGHAITATSHAYFGQGNGPIILDDMNCQGTELFLWQCASRHWGQHNCNHHEDAGVICSGPKARLSLSPDYDVFVKGDSVTFKCSIQRHNASKRLEFLRNSVYILHEELNPEDVSATYNIDNIGENDKGYYTCRYSYLMGTQWIKSTASDPVPLTLSDSPISRRRNSSGPMNRKRIIGLSAGMIIALVLGLFALNCYRKSGYIWERKGSRLHNLQPLITNQDDQDRTEDIDENSTI